LGTDRVIDLAEQLPSEPTVAAAELVNTGIAGTQAYATAKEQAG